LSPDFPELKISNEFSPAAHADSRVGYCGDAESFRRARSLIRRLARHDANILVSGETDTGKERRALGKLLQKRAIDRRGYVVADSLRFTVSTRRARANPGFM
jgi:DNA-binding NtrC family response regulator